MAARPGMMKTEPMSNDSPALGSLPAALRILGARALALLAAASACDMEEATTDHAWASAPDRVAGNLIMLDENGGWSWFQDERVIHDAEGQQLVFSSVANYVGHAGERRDADVDVTTFALATGRRTRVAVSNVPTRGVGDDHNAAALWQRPDGRYLAMYTGHLYHRHGVPESFYRITTSPSDGSGWGPEHTFAWPANDTIEPIDDDVTYSNLLYLSAEDRLYNIARAADRTPSIMVSDDRGATWRYAGKLSVTDADGQQGQYSNGYFKLSSNGVDRFDFIATEHHPWHFNTSIYHGYVHGGRTYAGNGNLVDDDIFDEVAPEPAQLASVWRASEVADTSYHHAWTVDLERDEHGGLYALFTTRYGRSIASEFPGDADHRLFYGRFDGSQWHTTELAKMGGPLHPHQKDYTGLGAIHPNDPNKVYVSTPFDPRYGSQTPQYEIYEGVTRDGGASWAWTAITCNSTVDNLRPIIPAWDASHTAVLWLRGRYRHMRAYDLGVVGIIDRSGCESTSRITYVDADESNTTLADGSPLGATAGAWRGRADDRWHERHGFGNAGRVLASNEGGDEDAPRLRTRLDGLAAGTYDVFVFQWAHPAEDWRIQAGLSTSDMLVLRQKASQLATPDHFEDSADVTLLGGSARMYRAYVGRADVPAAGTIDVLVDDVGGGGVQRTWYDGLGYARVSTSTECR